MDQIMIDIEDNENSGYFPIQVFEIQGQPRSAAVITVPSIPGSDEPYEVVGWCSAPGNGGVSCEATAVIVGDSGSGQALMIHGAITGSGCDRRPQIHRGALIPRNKKASRT